MINDEIEEEKPGLFEETLLRLEDCWEHMSDNLTERERRCRSRLIQLCSDTCSMYAADYL